MKRIYLTRCLFLCLAAMPLYAGVILLPDHADYQFSGDTSLGDAFNRPVANGDMAPTSLSLDADDDGYDTLYFTVTTPGNYHLEVTATDLGFSSYLFLYQTAFDPTDPLANILLGQSSDDPSSSLSATLFANTVYIAVTTGFSNFDEGPYSGEITEIAALAPEPSTFVLISAMVTLSVVIRKLKFRSRPTLRGA